MSRSEPRSPLDPELFPELAEWVDWSAEDGFTDEVEAVEPADAPSYEVVWRLSSHDASSELHKRPDPALKPSEAGSLESLLKEREFLNWAQYADSDLKRFLISPTQVFWIPSRSRSFVSFTTIRRPAGSGMSCH